MSIARRVVTNSWWIPLMALYNNRSYQEITDFFIQHLSGNQGYLFSESENELIVSSAIKINNVEAIKLLIDKSTEVPLTKSSSCKLGMYVAKNLSKFDQTAYQLIEDLPTNILVNGYLEEVNNGEDPSGLCNLIYSTPNLIRTEDFPKLLYHVATVESCREKLIHLLELGILQFNPHTITELILDSLIPIKYNFFKTFKRFNWLVNFPYSFDLMVSFKKISEYDQSDIEKLIILYPLKLGKILISLLSLDQRPDYIYDILRMFISQKPDKDYADFFKDSYNVVNFVKTSDKELKIQFLNYLFEGDTGNKYYDKIKKYLCDETFIRQQINILKQDQTNSKSKVKANSETGDNNINEDMIINSDDTKILECILAILADSQAESKYILPESIELLRNLNLPAISTLLDRLEIEIVSDDKVNEISHEDQVLDHSSDDQGDILSYHSLMSLLQGNDLITFVLSLSVFPYESIGLYLRDFLKEIFQMYQVDDTSRKINEILQIYKKKSNTLPFYHIIFTTLYISVDEETKKLLMMNVGNMFVNITNLHGSSFINDTELVEQISSVIRPK